MNATDHPSPAEPLNAWRANASPAYLAAYDAHGKAFAKYTAIRADYRARKIGDAEFLDARAEMERADRAFDLAFIEEKRAADVRNR